MNTAIKSWKQHQKTAKYCLSKQNKKLSNDHICVACGKEFQDDQRKQINDLTDRIQSMAEKAIAKPSIVNKNIIILKINIFNIVIKK